MVSAFNNAVQMYPIPLAFFLAIYQRLETQQKWAGWKSMRMANRSFFPPMWRVLKVSRRGPKSERACWPFFQVVFPAKPWLHLTEKNAENAETPSA